jgi:hypothetical protein
MWLYCVVLLALAWIIPAPLQEAADPTRVPNPAKSAWFLLWLQELVSYSVWWIYLLLPVGALFLILPWLPGARNLEHAVWLDRKQRPIQVFTMVGFAAIIVLTIIAWGFRGQNWAFIG